MLCGELPEMTHKCIVCGKDTTNEGGILFNVDENGKNASYEKCMDCWLKR